MNARTIIFMSLTIFSIAFTTDTKADEIQLTAISFQPETIVYAKHFYRFVSEINNRCMGKVSVNIIGSKTIASHKQWHALKSGAIDIYFGPANYYRGVLSQADALNLAHNGPAEQRRNGAWSILNELHNAHMNAWYLTTLLSGVKFYIYTTKTVNNGRFDGLRMRAVPLYKLALESFGAETQQLAAGDVQSALERGEIDGFAWPLWGLQTFGWDKITKFRYGPGFMNAAAPVLVNLDKWKSLSDEQRTCLTEMALWVEKEWPKWRATEDASQLTKLENAGVHYMDLADGFARQTEGIYWGMLTKSAPAFVKKIRPLLKNSN